MTDWTRYNRAKPPYSIKLPTKTKEKFQRLVKKLDTTPEILFKSMLENYDKGPKMNTENLLSVRTDPSHRDKFFELCKRLDLSAGEFFETLLKNFENSYVPVSNRVTLAKGQTGNFERLRQQLGDYLAAGNSIESVLDLLEQFAAGETQRENQKIAEGKMSKNQKLTKADIQRALVLSRQILEDGGASLEDSREAAAVFLAAGGEAAELAQLAKGKPATPKSADEIKAEMLAKSTIEQDRHLAKARGWQ